MPALPATYGVFAFISILGIIPRMADRFGLADHIYQTETVIALGGVSGAVLSVFQFHLGIGMIGLVIFGLCAGAFVGAVAMSLAETLKVIPILFQRTNLQMGLPVIITALAIGKFVVSILQLYFWR